MADAWDDPVPLTGYKVEFEDQHEDDLKENWDDESDDEEEVKVNGAANQDEKDKLSKSERISLKQEARQKVAAAESAEKEELNRPKTQTELNEEKEKQIKAQLASDFEMTLDLFGGISETDKEKFKDEHNLMAKKLCQNLVKFEKFPFYVDFLDQLFKDLCAGLSTSDVQQLAKSLTFLHQEKQKQDKAKTKKPSSKKGGLKLGKATGPNSASDWLGLEDEELEGEGAAAAGAYDEDLDDLM